MQAPISPAVSSGRLPAHRNLVYACKTQCMYRTDEEDTTRSSRRAPQKLQQQHVIHKKVKIPLGSFLYPLSVTYSQIVSLLLYPVFIVDNYF